MKPPTSILLLLPGPYSRYPSYLLLKSRPHTTSQCFCRYLEHFRRPATARFPPRGEVALLVGCGVPFGNTKPNEVYITSLVSSLVPHPTPMQGSTYPSRSRSPAQQEVGHVSGSITKCHSPRLKTEALF